MNFNDGTTKTDAALDKTTTVVDAAHETPQSAEHDKTEQQKIDHSAMQSAQRGTNRIHQAEQEAPDSTLFTK